MPCKDLFGKIIQKYLVIYWANGKVNLQRKLEFKGRSMVTTLYKPFKTMGFKYKMVNRSKFYVNRNTSLHLKLVL